MEVCWWNIWTTLHIWHWHADHGPWHDGFFLLALNVKRTIPVRVLPQLHQRTCDYKPMRRMSHNIAYAKPVWSETHRNCLCQKLQSGMKMLMPEHTRNLPDRVIWSNSSKCVHRGFWRCSDDALTMLWRCSDDALTMLWRCSDDALTMLTYIPIFVGRKATYPHLPSISNQGNTKTRCLVPSPFPSDP